MLKATGTLRKIRTRDSFILLVNKWKGIPYWIQLQKYETKHYYLLITDEWKWEYGLGPARWKKYKKHLITFTQVHEWKFDTQGDNYKKLQPDKLIGKEVSVEARPALYEDRTPHIHYGEEENYADKIEEAV